ncbi:uncharacterized protein BDV17DRAFT_49402 [Aspergillus undulatus]|uniref:uncharacterized protein n=1 Tax=Aspergillus undulatus TaxID=1810928 RepID=UPI003CCDDF45
MSFGSPGGGATNVKPTPPERGSFPLDHDGECKHLIQNYLKCLKSQRGVNDEECRLLAKGYLACRMDKNLMAPDDFKNLGLVFDKDKGKGNGGGEMGYVQSGGSGSNSSS